MEEDSSEMHSNDGKRVMEKNRKRTVKTRDQVQALENFYNEHKYPTEAMKLQLAEAIGLTEKQVSGWFCHRRLKDKKLINEEKYTTGKQDRSTGVILDHASGPRQDSCGSTKLGGDRNLDAREVESERLIAKDVSAAGITYEHDRQYVKNYNHMEDPSTGSHSDSLLRNMPNYQNVDPFDAAAARRMIPKISTHVTDLKTRSGPSGYLKVKGRVENAAITLVKKQLGRHYRENGPSLGVEFEFDPLPPAAFESLMQEPVGETGYTGETVLTASADDGKPCQNTKFYSGSKRNYSLASCNFNADRTSFRKRRGCDSPDGYKHEKFRSRPSLSNTGVCYLGNSSSVQVLMAGSQGPDDYIMKPRQRPEVKGIDSVSGHQRDSSGKVCTGPAESKFHSFNAVDTEVPLREYTENAYSDLTMKRKKYHCSGHKSLARETIKDGKMYPDPRVLEENQVGISFKNDLLAPGREKEELPLRQYRKMSSVVDQRPQNYRIIRSAVTEMRSSSDKDDENAQTSSSSD